MPKNGVTFANVICTCKAVPNYIFVSRKLDVEKPTRQPGKKKRGHEKKTNCIISSEKPIKGSKKNRNFRFFFLKIWPKTYQHIYEKQRYNLEWPHLLQDSQDF